MSVRNDEAKKTPFLTVKDTSTGKIQKIVFPSEVHVGLKDNPSALVLFGGISLATINFITSLLNQGVYGAKNDDTIIEVTVLVEPTSGRVRINLPQRPRKGQIHFIKDGSGTAEDTPIDIYPPTGKTIDGETFKTIETDYGSLAVYYSPTGEWRVLVSGGGSAATGSVDSASFLTVNAESSLSNERRFVSSSNISVTDNGADSTFFVDLKTTGVGADTYVTPRLAVDVNGRITSASNVQFSGSDGISVVSSSNTVLITYPHNGFLSRHVYVNAASSYVGQTHLGVEVEAAPTWTNPSDIPPGSKFRVQLFAAAPGGMSGPIVTAGSTHAGSASGGGASREEWYSRQELIDALPIVWDLQLGGAGGVGPSGTGLANAVPGSAVADPAKFGDLLIAYPGGRQTQGNVANSTRGGGGGGGEEGEGGDTTSSNAGSGGPPLGGATTAGGNNPSLFGGGSGGGSGKGGASRTGGGGGGSSLNNGGAPTEGGGSQRGSTGGGGGAGITSGGTPGNGAAGGPRLSAPEQAGAAGGLAAGDKDGEDGDDCTAKQGGMGGGGGAADAGTGDRTGGNGGNGGLGGGGGGGGGAARSTDGGNMKGGNGGNGGDAAGIFEAYA